MNWAIILNQISACISYKSSTYKRHVMRFWRNNFCLSCMYFLKIFPNKCFQINISEVEGLGKNMKSGFDHTGGCL